MLLQSCHEANVVISFALFIYLFVMH